MDFGPSDILEVPSGVNPVSIRHCLISVQRELPIVQAIVGTGRESKSERKAFQQGILNATYGGYPLIKWTTELEMGTEMRQCLIETGFTPEGTSKISEGPKSIY
jgi:hypothetical protein